MTAVLEQALDQEQLFAGVNVEHKGWANSFFQKDPFAPHDIWGDFMRKGINQQLQELWQLRNSNFFSGKEQVYAGVRSIFQPTTEKRAFFYDKEGVFEVENRIDIMQLDINVLTEIFNAEGTDQVKAGMLLDALAAKINDSFQTHNLRTEIIINQYAGYEGYDRQECLYLYQQIQSSLNTALRERLDDATAAKLSIEPVPYRAGVDVTFWKEQIDEIKREGGNSFRVSAEQSRLMTADGEIDEANFAYFEEIIAYAKEQDLKVMICFQHFTFPKWVKGDWSNPESAKIYADYVETVIRKLGTKNLPDWVLTINEPTATLPAGYLAGEWPPFRGFGAHELWSILRGDYKKEAEMLGIDIDPRVIIKNLNKPSYWFPRRFRVAAKRIKDYLGAFSSAVNNSIEGHIMARERIKQLYPDLPVGYSHNTPVFAADNKNGIFRNVKTAIDSVVLEYGNNIWERRFIERCVRDSTWHADFFGHQYYNMYVGAESLGANLAEVEVDPRYDQFINGWIRYPEGMIVTALRLACLISKTSRRIKAKTGQEQQDPGIFVTECGLPSIVDPSSELKVIFEAVNKTAELIPQILGVLAWTQNEDLEWIKGYLGAFGKVQRNGLNKPHPQNEAKALDLNDERLVKAIFNYRQEMLKRGNADRIGAIDKFLHQYVNKDIQQKVRRYGRKLTLLDIAGRLISGN